MIDIVELEKERFAWALDVFPQSTAISSLRKLEDEIGEIEADILEGIKNPTEYADALMCLFDSAGRNGITPTEIFEAFEKKLAINKSRDWVKNDNNTYSHVKHEAVDESRFVLEEFVNGWAIWDKDLKDYVTKACPAKSFITHVLYLLNKGSRFRSIRWNNIEYIVNPNGDSGINTYGL